MSEPYVHASKPHVHKWLCADGISNDCEDCEKRDTLLATLELANTKLAMENITLEAERDELRQALDEIAGGIGNKANPLPSLDTSPAEFQHAMWTWSQKRARAARESKVCARCNRQLASKSTSDYCGDCAAFQCP